MAPRLWGRSRRNRGPLTRWEEDNQFVGSFCSLERHASPDKFPNHKLPRPRIELAHKVNVPGTEALIAEPRASDHLEAVYPVDRYEVPVVHRYEMPVSHMKRATVEVVELPALLWPVSYTHLTLPTNREV